MMEVSTFLQRAKMLASYMSKNISMEQFIAIFAENEHKFDLPKLWDGRDYYISLFGLFHDYLNCIPHSTAWELQIYKKAEKVCDSLLDIVSSYLHGFPSKAYELLEKLMDIEYEENPLYYNADSILDLYRMVKVDDTIIYGRERVYHVPYHLRAKIATCRYSIAGYPSLYLSSSLELCDEETKLFSSREKAIASKFWISRTSRPDMLIIDFGYRPQDIITSQSSIEEFLSNPEINIYDDPDVDWDKLIPKYETTRLERYLIWYPLIASCSFVRSNRNNPFAPEYIVPQLITQWIRTKSKNTLSGIRYFSCASVRASGLGYNYVFPTSGNRIIRNGITLDYCPLINEAFTLSRPVFLNEYTSFADCDKAMDEEGFEKLAPVPEEDFDESPAFVVPFGVSRISAQYFRFCGSIKSLTLPETLVCIEDNAFLGCRSIRELKLPNNLQEIGDYAFADCTSLKALVIPQKTQKIGVGAFSGCLNLINLEVDPKNSRYMVVNGNLIDKESRVILHGTKPLVNNEDLCISKIGECAYKNCNRIKNIDIPSSVKTIEPYAFYCCKEIRKVSFGDGLMSIGEYSFYGCKMIREISLPKSVDSIGNNAFNNCNKLTRITVDKENRTYFSAGNCIIDKRTRELVVGCKNSCIPVRAKVKRISDDAFSNCMGLKNFRIPSSVATVGNRAFWGCNDLLSIEIDCGVVEIGEEAFWRCEQLETIYLPASIKRIGKRAFFGCSKLENIYFEGIEEEWNFVKKEEDWDWDTGTFKVIYKERRNQ